MWAQALHRRLTKDSASELKWTVTSFDPGLMPGTGLAREANVVLRFVLDRIVPHLISLLRRVVSVNIHNPQQSGTNLALLAVNEKLDEVSGMYFEGRKEIK